ncbi:MAG TPA: class I SAM-dependent methyltransferase [Dehalococcoidia bacterium]|nr:class I SAM-dependent methyltransferase [Dehalococcoidia bacterium]
MFDKTSEMMEKEWSERAKKDAFHFTLVRGGKIWDEQEFFESGRADICEFALSLFKEVGFNPKGKRMLDLGCGVGRMTRAFAQLCDFDEVCGVDVSEEMIALAKEFNQDIFNIKFIKNNGLDLRYFGDGYFDFVFSYIVFQHIPDKEIIFKYIDEVARVLKYGGYFKFQLSNEYAHRAFGKIPVPWFIISNSPKWIIERLMELPFKWEPRENIKLRTGRTWTGTRRVSQKELTKVIRDSHLKILKTEGTRYLWYSTQKSLI